jgi:large repetitive protein
VRTIKASATVIALAAAIAVALPAPAWATSSIPSAPRSVRLTPGNGRATVRWHAPVNDGDHPVTGYEVIPYLNNFALPTNFFHSTATSEVIVGLQNGKTYTFKVAAKNSVGLSRLSARSAGVTIGVPLASPKPTAVAGTGASGKGVPGKGQATVSWRAPGNNGAAVTSYRVTPLIDGAAQPTRVFASAPTHQIVSGLKGGVRYTFEVAAHNARGWGATSNPSAPVTIGK